MINFDVGDVDDDYEEIESLEEIMMVTSILREEEPGRPAIKEASFIEGDPTPRIVKQYNKNAFQQQANDPHVEIQALTDLSTPIQHPNIQRLINIYKNNDCYFLILEKYQNIFDVGVDVESDEFTIFFIQIISTLKYIHSKGYAHLDINYNNLMVSSETPREFSNFYPEALGTEGCPVFIDFGSSSPNNIVNKVFRWAERRAYHPPELMEEDAERYGVNLIKYDVWSLGVLLYQLILEDCPFAWVNRNDLSYQNFLREYEENKFLEGYDFPDDRIRIALMQMLNPNPDKRPTTEEILHIFGF